MSKEAVLYHNFWRECEVISLPMTNYHHLICLNHFVDENLDGLHIVISAALLSTFQEHLVETKISMKFFTTDFI